MSAKDIIDVLKTAFENSWKFTVTVGIVSAILLFDLFGIVTWLRLGLFVYQYKSTIALIFLAAVIYSLVGLIAHSWKSSTSLISRWNAASAENRAKSAATKAGFEALRDLSFEERIPLAILWARGERRYISPFQETLFEILVHKNLMTRTEVSYCYLYEISEGIWAHIRQIPWEILPLQMLEAICLNQMSRTEHKVAEICTKN